VGLVDAIYPVEMDHQAACVDNDGTKVTMLCGRRAHHADALLILTDWKEFGKLDLCRLNQALKFQIGIDECTICEPRHMLGLGFRNVSVGRHTEFSAQQGKPSG
jgi:UDP-glucose 6-dehydrogenase